MSGADVLHRINDAVGQAVTRGEHPTEVTISKASYETLTGYVGPLLTVKVADADESPTLSLSSMAGLTIKQQAWIPDDLVIVGPLPIEVQELADTMRRDLDEMFTVDYWLKMTPR